MYEEYRDQMNAQVLRMLEDNLKWLESLPKEGAKADGCKHQDKQESL